MAFHIERRRKRHAEIAEEMLAEVTLVAEEPTVEVTVDPEASESVDQG